MAFDILLACEEHRVASPWTPAILEIGHFRGYGYHDGSYFVGWLQPAGGYTDLRVDNTTDTPSVVAKCYGAPSKFRYKGVEYADGQTEGAAALLAEWSGIVGLGVEVEILR